MVETIPGSRAKKLLLCLVSVALVAASVLLIVHPTKAGQQYIGFGGAALFGLAFLVSVAGVLRPGRLVIDDRGVEIVQAVGRTHRIEFADVDTFFVLTIRGSRMVGYNYRPEVKRSRMSQVSRGLTDADGGFSGPWQLPVRDVVARLNARMGGEPA